MKANIKNNPFNVAVIFAGGKSSRMGKDKALLPFNGYATLAEYQYERLFLCFEQVYVSSKSNKFDFDVNIIADKYEIASPLVALISIFETLDVEEVFVLSVDAPFVSEKVIEKLYEEIEDDSFCVVAESPNGVEPLCAIYRRSILPKAKEALALNNHRLFSLLDELDAQKVFIEESKLFMNLNHPFEYDEALKLLKV